MKEIFWNTIASYNAATWPWQLAFITVAAVLTLLLWFRPRRWVRIAAKLYMVIISLWIAFVYYLKFASAREHSEVLAIFWCMMALAWIYDLVTNFSSFSRSGKASYWGLIVLVLPLAYPFISISRGFVFPGITMPVLPSAVALYMLGMLMTFNEKINFFAYIFILHWSIIAISKITLFDIPEDILLAVSSIPAMVIFFTRSLKSMSGKFKPSDKTVTVLISAVAVLLAGSLLAG